MRELALLLARAGTCTPVSHWMSEPVMDLMDWVDTVEAVAKREKRAQK